MAAIANDIENGNNLHEYYNENGAQIKAASKREQTQTGLQYAERERAQLKVKAGQFGTFADFLSYYRQHYRPILQAIADGEDLTAQPAALLRFMAQDLLDVFADDGDTDQGEDVSEGERERMEREAVTEFVTKYIGWCESDIDTAEDKDTRRAFRRKLARYAYEGRAIAWTYAVGNVPEDHPRREWLKAVYTSIADRTNPRTELYNRYARMYARQSFEHSYKRVAKSLFAADCEGTDKLRKKQAVVDGLQVLCDKMEEYVCRQDDEDFKGWEPQMIIRYESETGDTENYWNLFVYCTGPNDQDGDDYLSLATAWQHVWTDSDGRDATDDYGTEEHPTRAALVRYLFYGEPQEFDETDEKVVWQRMTDVWVD